MDRISCVVYASNNNALASLEETIFNAFTEWYAENRKEFDNAHLELKSYTLENGSWKEIPYRRPTLL